MLSPIADFIKARPRETATSLIGFFILILVTAATPANSAYDIIVEEASPETQTYTLSSSVPYTASGFYSKYQKQQYQIRELTETINYEVQKMVRNKEIRLITKASKVKHTTPFKAGTKSRNSINRYGSWVSSDRAVRLNTPRHYALSQFKDYGWEVSTQWGCLDRLWWHESNWKHTAGSPDQAYGIPQAAPGSKMKSAGADWKTNPETQIDWGLSYISNRYGNPCGAFKFWKNEAENGTKGYGWY